MTPPDPEVSVVIPTRDRTQLLRRAVASALAQHGTAVEVVVVDDGSREPVKWEGNDPVMVVRHASSRGVAAARNAGAAAARSPWLAFLDDDDYWAPDKLRTQLAHTRGKRADFVYCAALVVAKARVVNMHPAPPAMFVDKLVRRANVIPAGSSNVLVDANLFRRTGGFDARLRHLADWDMWSRLLDVAVPAHAPEGLIAYVQHPANMHATDLDTVRREARLLRTLHREGPIMDFDEGMFALFIAEGHRQAERHWRAATVHGLAGLRHRRFAHLKLAAVEGLHAAGLRRRLEPSWPTPEWVLDQW